MALLLSVLLSAERDQRAFNTNVFIDEWADVDHRKKSAVSCLDKSHYAGPDPRVRHQVQGREGGRFLRNFTLKSAGGDWQLGRLCGTEDSETNSVLNRNVVIR